ncbi:PREDICTED: death-associated inhibitor of apoptosis 2-like, partial [Diuraphis noxia]|uniref:death-associated inhibitor of apoptosis 2-like n=1 Tax=Diuraphis noxia TaxID=143948 RepID=UPI00076385CA
MNLPKLSSDFQSLVHRIRNNSVPTHSGYSSIYSRLRSLEHFPLNCFQNKYALAECGLKYTGVEDIVECFCCGLILHNWKREDDVWIEHCRYNPKCIYV